MTTAAARHTTASCYDCGDQCHRCNQVENHNSNHLFGSTTSSFKSGPKVWCLVHSGLDMCFAPQRRALFDTSISKTGPVPGGQFSTHLIWQSVSRHNGGHFFDISSFNWSENVLLCTFGFGKGFRATTACTFLTSQLPNLGFFTCKFASHCFAPEQRAIFHFSSGQLALHPPL